MDYVEVVAMVLAVSLALPLFALMNPYSWSPSGMPSVEPPNATGYTPPAGNIPLVGDVWWLVDKVFGWFFTAGSLVGDILQSVGVPPEWSRAVSGIVSFLFLLFAGMAISGRVIKYSGGGG